MTNGCKKLANKLLTVVALPEPKLPASGEREPVWYPVVNLLSIYRWGGLEDKLEEY